MLIIAGPNGSGKTTITRHLVNTGVDLGRYINADDIAAAMPAGHSRDREAQLEAERLRRECLDNGVSFTFETVMSHPGKIDEMHEARSLGFEVHLVFVGLENPKLNVARVAERVTSGGHPVPVDKIISRYARTMANLPQAMLAADHAIIFDNSRSGGGHRQIAISKMTFGDNRKTNFMDVRIFKPEQKWFRTVFNDPDWGLTISTIRNFVVLRDIDFDTRPTSAP